VFVKDGMRRKSGRSVLEARKRMTDVKESFECTVLCSSVGIDAVGGLLE
jgi:hypothetical protein